MRTITTYSSTRTETRRADALVEGDHIIDPNDGHSILIVWRVERLGFSIYVDAMKRRSVTRKLFPSETVAVCIPQAVER